MLGYTYARFLTWGVLAMGVAFLAMTVPMSEVQAGPAHSLDILIATQEP